MNPSHIFAAVLSLSVFACASEQEALPSLVVAPPIQYGTTCNKYESSSFETARTSTVTAQCMPFKDCSEEKSERDVQSYGGYYFNSYTYYADVKWFSGTCDAPKPITCDKRAGKSACDKCGYEKCCVAIAICEDDPNCMAIVDCAVTCKADQKCVDSCFERGEPSASTNLQAASKCLSTSCKADCSK